jgi:hypothetical protein
MNFQGMTDSIAQSDGIRVEKPLRSSRLCVKQGLISKSRFSVIVL